MLCNLLKILRRLERIKRYFDGMLESDLLLLSLNQSLSQANEIVKFLINVATIMLNLDYAHDQRFERLSTLLMLSVIE